MAKHKPHPSTSATRKFLTGEWLDERMAVTHFAGTLLVVGAVVAALNWRHSIPVETDPAAAAGAPDRAETAHLFSASGPKAITIPPAAGFSLWPEVKLPVKKSTSVQGASTTGSPPKL